MAFNHEVVPDYLRTKPDADAEEKITHLHNRGNIMAAENVSVFTDNYACRVKDYTIK